MERITTTDGERITFTISTWADLKKLCNKLTKEQLSNPVRVEDLNREQMLMVTEVDIVEEDYHCWEGEDYLEPKSECEEYSDSEDPEFPPLVLKKVAPIIVCGTTE